MKILYLHNQRLEYALRGRARLPEKEPWFSSASAINCGNIFFASIRFQLEMNHDFHKFSPQERYTHAHICFHQSSRINDLLGSKAYYCIGYCSIQDGAPWPAFCVRRPREFWKKLGSVWVQFVILSHVGDSQVAIVMACTSANSELSSPSVRKQLWTIIAGIVYQKNKTTYWKKTTLRSFFIGTWPTIGISGKLFGRWSSMHFPTHPPSFTSKRAFQTCPAMWTKIGGWWSTPLEN